MRNPIKLDGTLDKGVVCESLLFFNKLHLLIDLGTLGALIQANFFDDLIAMLEANHLTANFSPEASALYTDTKHGLSEHLFTVIKLTGDQKRRNLRNSEIMESQLLRLCDNKTKARGHYRKLCDLISFEDIGDGGVGQLGRDDIRNPEFAKEVARMALQSKGIPESEIPPLEVEIVPLVDNKFAIVTNIDFDRLRRFVPESERSTFSQKDLFPAVGDARLDINIAAKHNAAFVGNERNVKIVEMILRRTLGAQFEPNAISRQIYDFISVATPTVREVINSGSRSTNEFIKLPESAEGFRKWLGVQNPSADLIREMLREKAEVGWLGTLPIKALRLGLFTGLGKLGDAFAPGISLVAEGVDMFLLEQLANRWRPHYFVEHNLKGFLDTKQPETL
jgi:hypothetical protein